MIGACPNSTIEIVDGKTVETNSRIMMKNLSKMRENGDMSTSKSHSRANNTTSSSSISTKKSSRNSSSKMQNINNLQPGRRTNGGSNLLTPSSYENSQSKFDAQIGTPSTSIPLSKTRNESSTYSLATSSSISAVSSLSENSSNGYSSTTHQKSNGVALKRFSANEFNIPAPIEEK